MVRKKNRKTTRINPFFQLIHQEGLTPPQVFDIFSKSLKSLESSPSTSRRPPVVESPECRLSGPIQPNNGLTVSDALYPRFCHDSPLLWGIYDASFSRIFPGSISSARDCPAACIRQPLQARLHTRHEECCHRSIPILAFVVTPKKVPYRVTSKKKRPVSGRTDSAGTPGNLFHTYPAPGLISLMESHPSCPTSRREP